MVLSALLWTASAQPLSLPSPSTNRISLLNGLVHDSSPKTRLAALRALAHIPTAESAALALTVLDHPMDPTLDYALWLTINDLSVPFVEALQSGAWKPEGREKQLEFALRAIPAEQAGRVLEQLLATRPFDEAGTGPWMELVGGAGSPAQLRAIFERAVDGKFSSAATVRALNALSEAFRQRKSAPVGDVSSLSALFASASLPVDVRVAALRLSALWKERFAWIPTVLPVAREATTPSAVRSAAFDAIRTYGGKDSLAALDELVRSTEPPISRAAVIALSGVDLQRAIPSIIAMCRVETDETAALEFWRAVLDKKGAARALADALPDHGLQPAAARAGMRAAREGGRSDLDLVLAFARGAGLSAGASAASTGLIQDLAAQATAKGDPTRGERLFRRNDTACMTCHGIGGAGGKVGPDLTSIGASAPMDYLVESVLLPNVKIKEGYAAVIVTSRDGTERAGTLARETGVELVLRLASGQEESIPKVDILKREIGVNSIMPSGLLESLNQQEQLDLFSFLGHLGKPGPFDAARGGVARKWHLTQTVHTDGQEGREYWPLTAGLSEKRWHPIYALVRGVITREMIAEANGGEAWTSRLAYYAATEFSLLQNGTVTLTLTAGPGSELWVDGKKVGPDGISQLTLTAGNHRAVVRMDPKNVPASVRLESADVSFVLN